MAAASTLKRLLRPRSIALVGGQAAARVAEQCDRLGFDGDIWPVHPTRERIAGRQAYSSVAALPAAPDAAFVGVNRNAAVETVAALAERGAGGVVCYAAGFREADDGAELQDALLDAAGAMPLVGPNCYGCLNLLDGLALWPDQHGAARVPADRRGVGIVTQSSNIAISMTMQRRGLPIGYVLTAGNQAQLGVADLAAALVDDERVSAIGVHVEGFGDLAAWELLAAKARDQGVPVVVLPAGRTRLGQALALSHTASLAGAAAGADALLARLGIGRANNIAEFLEALKLLHVHGPLPGRRLGSLSCSGGEASLMADAVAETALALPPLGDAEQAVAATVHPLVAVGNPLDYHTFAWGNEAALRRTFDAFVAGPFDIAALVLDLPRTDRCDDADWQTTLAAWNATLDSVGVPGAVIATLPENLPEADADRLIELGIAPLCGLPEALAAIACAAAIGDGWEQPPAAPLLADCQVEAYRANGAIDVDEADAKRRLAEFGLTVPPGDVAATGAEAAAIATSLGGTVAVKALGVAHKTECGALRVGLHGADAVAAAAEEMLPLGNGKVLVERCVDDVVAELIVGVSRDPAFGLLLTVGTGGTLVELLQDSATLLLPATAAAVREAIAGLRGAAMLRGYRGRPVGNEAAAVEAVLAVAAFAAAHRRSLLELDVNPLAITPTGAVALDALLRVAAPGAPA